MLNENLNSILIVGNGGREHAIGWKLAGSRHVEKLYFAPGNAGTAQLGKNLDIDTRDLHGLVRFAKDNKAFTVVGPESPIVSGIEYIFTEAKLPIFAPSREAARLESSKAWAVGFMKRHSIPHPDSRIFSTSDDAFRFVENSPWKELVIKADGLASGKGVYLPETQEEAKQAIIDLMILDKCGDAGDFIVIQEKLKGDEVSMFALCDGATIMPLVPVRDYKRVLDHDEGLNTGGMGSYTPLPYVSPKTIDTINKTILIPTMKGMKEEGRPYKGVLYAGLMLTDEGPKVLEYNARFGDPETQSMIRRLASDLGPLLLSCVEGTLSSSRSPRFLPGAAVCVVLASQRYPERYEKGVIIKGLDKIKDPSIKIFHTGTIIENGRVVTDGGRVLGVTAYADTLSHAVEKAYRVIGHPLAFDNMHYRRDIGK